MKRTFSLSLVAALIVGCTVTHVRTPTLELRRVSVLQRVQIPSVTVTSNGTVSLTGYTNDGGGETFDKLLGTAVRAAVSAAK